MQNLNYGGGLIDLEQAKYMLSLRTDFHPDVKSHVLEPRFECLVGKSTILVPYKDFVKYSNLDDAVNHVKNSIDRLTIYMLDRTYNGAGFHNMYEVEIY